MKPISLGVMGAMSSLVALPMTNAAVAATSAAVPQARSFSQLLEPIPNASERLKLADAATLQEATLQGDALQRDARLVPAAYYYRWARHRVYFHRRYRRHYYYGYRYYAPIIPFYYRHHHHHHPHHHHHGYF
ncbi:MAG TPA: hypothetical protein VG407_01990 [Caulobacteraceae bacterium]|nr:hypothetical protein [Caulobacteraceae bacterium]